ncbi:MAG TPA: hypothetical protein GXX51_07270 [Firmicutes bacterium]|nr:hypothetical protein [Bacillota bacterium]
MSEKKRKSSRVDLTTDKFEMEVAEELGLANRRRESQASSKASRAQSSPGKGQVNRTGQK